MQPVHWNAHILIKQNPIITAIIYRGAQSDVDSSGKSHVSFVSNENSLRKVFGNNPRGLILGCVINNEYAAAGKAGAVQAFETVPDPFLGLVGRDYNSNKHFIHPIPRR